MSRHVNTSTRWIQAVLALGCGILAAAETDYNPYPYAARILFGLNEYKCSGALISHRVVLSVHQCEPSKSEILETIIALGIPSDQSEHFVDRVVVDPDRSVALFFAKNFISYEANVQPIAFRDETDIGPGYWASSIVRSTVPKGYLSFDAINMVTVSPRSCKILNHSDLPADMMCTIGKRPGTAVEKKGSPCLHDLGGPLVSHDLLIGLGTGQCIAGGPDQFIRVAPSVPFIISQLAD